MIGKYEKNQADILFADNIGSEIMAEVVTELIFKGKLVAISCNTFIIETKEGLNEMFRYEDLRLLQCRKYKESENDNETR